MSANACEIWFYHLERASLDQVLPELLEKTLARGWRALVRSPDPERIEHLDGMLWSYREDSFLPHGMAVEAGASRQPVLLTTDLANTNDAQVLFLVDDADPGEVAALVRCIVIFDGRDPEALAAARARWSDFKSNGHPLAYWRQNETRGWARQT